MIVKGIAATFETQDGDNSFLLPDCFDKWLPKQQQTPLLFQHKEHLILGHTQEVYKDSWSIRHISKIDDSLPAGRDVIKLINAGVLDSFSVGITFPIEETNNFYKGGYWYLHEADLKEISICVNPSGRWSTMEGIPSKHSEKSRDRLKRLDAFWDLLYRLEVPEIGEIIRQEWRVANRQVFSQL